MPNPPLRSPNTVAVPPPVARTERERLLGQRGAVVWLTGLSGAGKSTLAAALVRRLHETGRLAYVLDGDNLRHGLCGDLGFSPEDRAENVRRIAEVAALLADAGVITVVAAVSPYRADRARARARIGPEIFVEVHVATPLEVCRRRDPKGLYRRAEAGELTGMTGLDAPYEPPNAPALRVGEDGRPPEELAEAVLAHLAEASLLEAPADAV